MNIYIKNCNVTFCMGTETMNITGMKEPETKTAESVIKTAESVIKKPDGVISIQRTYTLEGFLANKAAVQPGDRVRLPEFTVPSVEMDGKNVMPFKKMTIADEAVVIDNQADESPVLLFSHCLFESAMDLNDESCFAQTQLALYLQGEFKRAMNNTGIPAETCGLVSKEEMFGKNALEYFKNGYNRMAFDFDEDCCRCYWLSTLYDKKPSGVSFCLATNSGFVHYDTARATSRTVRPRFTIHV